MSFAHILRGVAVAACLFGLGGPAHALLLAYEPFEYGDVAVPSEGQYAVGDDSTGINVLGGQNPTIGPTAFYTGGWIQSGGDAQAVRALPSLSHPGLPAGVGGFVTDAVQFSCCSFGRSGRAIAGGLGFEPDPRTIYESFLIDFGSQGTDDPTQFGLRGHELWNGGVGDIFLGMRLFLNHFAGVNELSLDVTTASGTTLVPVSGGGLSLAALAGTHLVVIKYAFDPAAPDVVSVYLDPAGPEPVTPDAQISVAASDFFITHQGASSSFTFSGAGHVPAAIDEIRWGDAYGDVVGPRRVPEPALGLLGVAAAGLIARRRRTAR